MNIAFSIIMWGVAVMIIPVAIITFYFAYCMILDIIQDIKRRFKR